VGMQWYYAIDGQRSGPVPHAELERLIQAGTITGEALVWRQGMDQWKTLADVQERDPALFAPVPPPLPPADEDSPAAGGDEPEPFRQASAEPAAVDAAAAEPLVYAGFWQRVGAHLVDLVLWFALVIIAMNIVGLLLFPDVVKLNEKIVAAGGSFAYQPTPSEAILLFKFMGFIALLSIVLAVVYDLFFVLRFSATPGKLLFGVRVVQADGKTLGVMRIITRTLTKGLAGIPTLGIGLLIVAFDEQKRGLHDFFSGTRVVKKR